MRRPGAPSAHRGADAAVDISALAPQESVFFVDHKHAFLGQHELLHPALLELELTKCALTKVENLEGCSALQLLSLNENAIEVVEGLEGLASLTQLELKDNAVKRIPELPPSLAQLTSLDLSYNALRKVRNVGRAALPALEELFLASNKIKNTSGLEDVSAGLTMLELGGNRLEAIGAEMRGLVSLEKLFLGMNRIGAIEHLSPLVKLRQLSLQSNRLTSLAGVDECASLEELYVSENRIESLAGMDGTKLPQLILLDVAGNRLRSLDGVQALSLLEDVWANANQLPELEAALDCLAALPRLETLYLGGNPCSRAKPPPPEPLAAPTAGHGGSVSGLLSNVGSADAQAVFAWKGATGQLPAMVDRHGRPAPPQDAQPAVGTDGAMPMGSGAVRVRPVAEQVEVPAGGGAGGGYDSDGSDDSAASAEEVASMQALEEVANVGIMKAIGAVGMRRSVLPGYRERVLERLPKLRQLDDTPVRRR